MDLGERIMKIADEFKNFMPSRTMTDIIIHDEFNGGLKQEVIQEHLKYGTNSYVEK